MKKNIIIFLVILLGAGLTFFAMNLSKEKTSTLAKEGLTNFSIKDTASIDKIALSSTLGMDFTVVRKPDGTWRDEAGNCVQDALIYNLIETIHRVEVKAHVPKGQQEKIMSNLNQSHVKCDIYTNGSLEKTYFVGSPTSDHYGTYMLLELPEKGRSPKPMITYIPGFRGNLQPRFNADWRQWACSGIFKYNPANIKKVSFKVFDDPRFDYEIESDGENTFKLSHHGEYVANFNEAKVRNYLLKFKKIHFNQHNYTMSEKQIDSIRNSNPYIQISVEGHDGENKSVKCYKMKASPGSQDIEGNPLIWDQDAMWAFLDNGDLVKVQYFVFDKISKSIFYFLDQEDPPSNVDN